LSEDGPTSKPTRRYPLQLREHAVQRVFEQRGEYSSEWRAISAIAQECGVTGETLRKWVRQAEVDGGMRAGTTSAEAARISELERENAQLRRANEILRRASAFFLRELDPQQRG